MVYYELPNLYLNNNLGSFNGNVYAIVQSGNFIFVGGDFTSYTDLNNKTSTCQRLVKINLSTGEVDATFDTVSGFGGQVNTLLLSGSSLYVGGSFITYKGLTRQRVVKINATTAALDGTFISSSAASSTVWSFALDGSNGLYIGGIFTSYQGTARERVCKVDATTGILDTTFDTSSGAGSFVFSLALDGSGGLYLGGSFTTYKGTARERVCKVDATTAALDSTFDTSTGASGGVEAIVLNGNDLYVGGLFGSYKGTAVESLVKINATTAVLDSTFDTSTAAVGTVRRMLLDGSGNLFITGTFLAYKSVTRQRIAKINATTAALDTTFDTTTGAGGEIYALYLNGNTLFLGGVFLTYKGNTRGRIARANAITAADIT